MKISNEMVENIKELRTAKFEDAKIIKMLGLTKLPDEILADFEAQKGLLTVDEVADKLDIALDSKEVWNNHKVLRLIKNGQIEPQDKEPAKRIGYRIKEDEVERFITEYKMTKEDWKKKVVEAENHAKELEVKNEELEKQLAEMKKEIAALKAEPKKTATRATKKKADKEEEQK